MNDRGRDVLIDAALRGVSQIKGMHHDGAGGMCALGVLHTALHNGDAIDAANCYFLAALANPVNRTCFMLAVYKAFDIDHVEAEDIWRANDHLNWDFLTIARKF